MVAFLRSSFWTVLILIFFIDTIESKSRSKSKSRRSSSDSDSDFDGPWWVVIIVIVVIVAVIGGIWFYKRYKKRQAEGNILQNYRDPSDNQMVELQAEDDRSSAQDHRA
mmetsp:Transcript_22346/g.25143  ORF Transcript_22346/g.25143 Transcript_22346/m.25143 type:complete len:109 (-) Transcript_22346:217-543(-)